MVRTGWPPLPSVSVRATRTSRLSFSLFLSTLSLDYSLKRPLYIQPAGGRSLMGKRSVIKLLITNSRGKNSQKLTRAFSVRYRRMYRMCARVNKIFTVAENCRALRLIIPSASLASRTFELDIARADNRTVIIEKISVYLGAHASR